MKLKKIVKHLDGISETIIKDADDRTVWEGDTYLLHVALDTKKEQKRFFSENSECIGKVLVAKTLMNRKLFTDEDGEAISLYSYKNDYGVTMRQFIIFIK